MAGTPVYRIHPGIGIARLGDSPDGICISPEGPARLPIACDSSGNTGKTETPVKTFKDRKGRIKRQAARFQIYVYDDDDPEGRPLTIGDPIFGGGNHGVLFDIQWRVHIANKKAVWFPFNALHGEAGYGPDTPRRNATVTAKEARQKLIIDPGPQAVSLKTRRKTSFSRDGNTNYAVSFPPTGMRPHDIDTLGDLLTDDAGRLLVLGGHGRSGSMDPGFGHPRIDAYANTDGWFDDISDGPVMARLVMYSKEVDKLRYIDVEYPAWVLVGYPRYAPEVLDIVTLEDLVEDLSIREFASRTDMFGTAGTFGQPEKIDPTDAGALAHWKAGKREWNPDYRPWFWRDIWSILFRPDEYSYFTNILAQSNYPHSQKGRGSFYPCNLSVPPRVAPRTRAKKQRRALDDHLSGQLLEVALEPALMRLETNDRPGALAALAAAEAPLGKAAAAFTAAVCPLRDGESPEAYAARWRAVRDAGQTAPEPAYAGARDAFDAAVGEAIAALKTMTETPAPEKLSATDVSSRQEPPARDRDVDPDEPLEAAIRRIAFEYRSGLLIGRALERAAAEATTDPWRATRQFLFDLLRKPGEENVFQLGGSPATRTYHLPLMPLLCGDNPLTNEAPSKFFRLTDAQLFLLRQWAAGKFVDECAEGWAPKVNPWLPYANWTAKTGRDLDRGVLSNLLGGSFCPGAEVSWLIRNPAIWRQPYQLKASAEFYEFGLTAAQQNQNHWGPDLAEEAYAAYDQDALSQDSDYSIGLEPGDLTKMSGLPWQADFNECSTQSIDVTYTAWCKLYPDSPNNPLMANETKKWETLWWPVHRPMQVWVAAGTQDGRPFYRMENWAAGIPQTYAGDLKMVTEWSKLGFVVRNPGLAETDINAPSPDYKYVSVEQTGD